ncbi:winged helix-turn-helix transcriptional regulator [Streptococcus sp. E29BA]|uniref:winged helix-turn-helix transcriptional regulator n=1 Tax=Streptococcus sp. E29BA TaxID=3278716 RepID=UPI00359DC60A
MVKICPQGFFPEDLENPTPLFFLLYTHTLLSGRWKPMILEFLDKGAQRFSSIQKHLGNLFQGSLTKQLKEMEADKLIARTVYPEVPPRVEYHLTDKGRDLLPLLELMVAFGERYQGDVSTNIKR